MKKTIRIFDTPAAMASELAEEIAEKVVASADKGKTYSIALSGGSTPALLYSYLFGDHAGTIPWRHVHLFWGDERCVPPDHPDSNYGMVQKYLSGIMDLPPSNIHTIKGEDDPVFEAIRYSGEISASLPERDKIPVFDLILLGMGEDGHTASIFPDQMKLLYSDSVCEVAVHPVSGQKRVTITGRVINNAEAVAFMVTGKGKAGVLREILNGETGAVRYPAFHIKPEYGDLEWCIDREAEGSDR